jgi:transposase
MSNTSNHPNTLIYHKPTCQCPPCKRRAQTEPVGSRGEGEVIKARQDAAAARIPPLVTQEVIYADGFPPVLVEDRSTRARVLQVIALKQKGLNLQQCAEKLGISYSYVRTLMWKAGKDGWLKFTDPMERFEHELMPKVVDNIEYWLDQKDKKMTIEAAKGGGIFRSHQTIKVEGQAPSQVLALKIEMPEGGVAPTAGKIIGTPRRLELPVVDATVAVELEKAAE